VTTRDRIIATLALVALAALAWWLDGVARGGS
jgi:hypothetical protein